MSLQAEVASRRRGSPMSMDSTGRLPRPDCIGTRNDTANALNLRVFSTSLGWVGIVGSAKGLCRLILPLASRGEVLSAVKDSPLPVGDRDSMSLGDLPQRLQRYFDGERVDFPDQLDLSGATRFQQDVWEVARTIPHGQTRSYGWVAEQLGKRRAVRAVGQALGKNPLPIIVPCHRVVRGDGSLGGFSGGLEMKRLLLRLENPSLDIR
jgi:methylated-DNA-[protein]-cysteine S-methyltransferase